MKTPTANSTRIALCDARGPLTDLLDKISGEDGGKWLHALKRMLREENPWDNSLQILPIWLTVKLGTGLKTADDFRVALKKIGLTIEKRANDILGQPDFTVSPEEVSLDLVMVSVRDLGFKEGATLQEIYERALVVGLELCPAEVGPQLVLQHPNQPMDGSALHIGMAPVLLGSDFFYHTFYINLIGCERWLDTSYVNPGGCFLGFHRFVFVRPKQVK